MIMSNEWITKINRHRYTLVISCLLPNMDIKWSQKLSCLCLFTVTCTEQGAFIFSPSWFYSNIFAITVMSRLAGNVSWVRGRQTKHSSHFNQRGHLMNSVLSWYHGFIFLFISLNCGLAVRKQASDVLMLDGGARGWKGGFSCILS